MPARDHDEVCALVHRIVSAWNAGDADTLAGAFADEGELFAFVRSLGSAQLASAVDGVRFVEHDIAVVDVTLVAVGRAHARRSAAGVVAMRELGGWRVVAFHDGPAPRAALLAAGRAH